jgi:hypothetical protein
LEKKLLLAHEELMKSQLTLSIAESEKAKDLRELFEGTCGDEGSIRREISIRTYYYYVGCSCY